MSLRLWNRVFINKLFLVAQVTLTFINLSLLFAFLLCLFIYFFVELKDSGADLYGLCASNSKIAAWL